jgi:regulator of sirC expression with transglutaminase-like and TPR domain
MSIFLAQMAKPSMIVGMDISRPAFCRTNAFRAFARELPTLNAPGGLFRAAWAISQHEHPDADVAEGEAVVANLIATVQGRVRSTSVEARLAHLHDVLFDLLGFQGNVDDYYSPSNNYLCEVLRTRRGLPITLTLLYRRVAQGIGLTVHGVNAPGHFLAEVEMDHGQGQSIYVDPFFGGGLLHEEEVFERILQATGKQLPKTAEQLARAAPRQWLGRMLNNLQAVFAATGRERDVYAMQEMQGLL